MEEFLLTILAVVALLVLIAKFGHILWAGKVNLPSNVPLQSYDRWITRQAQPRLYWLTVVLYFLFVIYIVFLAVSFWPFGNE